MQGQAESLADFVFDRADQHRIEQLKTRLEEIDTRPEETPPPEPAQGELAQLLEEGRQCVRSLVRMIEATAGEEHQSTHCSDAFSCLSRESDRLERIMEEVRRDLEADPDLDPAELPSWQLLRQAHSEIVVPHKRNVFLFKSAVLIARADGELSSIERDLLYAVAHRMHLAVAETHRLIEHAEQIRPSEFQGTTEQAVAVLQSLYLCALADGVVHKPEKRMLRRIASSLGVDDRQVEMILSGSTRASGIDFLDSEGVKEQLAGRAELPPDTYLPDHLSPERLEDLTDRLEVPRQEDILLAYDNRFLEQTFECAALTTQHLCIRPAEGTSTCVDLDRLEGIGARIHSSALNLSNGETIKLSRSGQGFLELLWECLEENLRSP
jgi:tellurite resistance protein